MCIKSYPYIEHTILTNRRIASYTLFYAKGLKKEWVTESVNVTRTLQKIMGLISTPNLGTLSAVDIEKAEE